MEYKNFSEMDNYEMSNSHMMTYEEVEKIAASKVRGSILWMVFGLLITGVVGYFTLNFLYMGVLPPQIIPVAMVLEVIAVIVFSAMTFRASASTLRVLFIVYSALTGVTLSVIGVMYDPFVIIYAFLGTVILFTVLAIYGYITKEDLGKYKTLLMTGLISLLVMGIINIFLKSDGLMWVSSMLGIIIFIIFIAYDVNRIKNNVIQYAMYEDSSILDKIEIHGALCLYLDFINLFIYLLRILRGRRR